MKQAVKLVIIDQNDKYLLIYRNNHPRLGTDPDLPGGTSEEGESLIDTLLREVKEEIGLRIDHPKIRKVYSSRDYAGSEMPYTLYVTNLSKRPEIKLSWEHSSYAWLDRETFLNEAKSANDSYMHMVYDALR